MRRGEVWWAVLPSPVGQRPVIILTRNSVLKTIDSLVVCLVTRTIRGVPSEVVLGKPEGLPTRCAANLDNLLTVPRTRLQRLMGSCDSRKLEELNAALRFALEVP